MKQIFVILCAFAFIAFPALADTGIQTTAKQAIIVDFDTGTVLLDKNADEKMPTSSMSKVMTTYVAYDALKKGEISEEQEVPVSEKAWKMEGSRMFLDVNKKVKIGDLIKGIVIQSGNDASVALAEGIAGSEEAYVVRMNEMAQMLGMKNSHFMDASGWPHDDHYSTARDLATLGMAVIRDFPERYKIYSDKEFVYNNIKQGNRNPLLYKNMGADGVKTGHTDAGGYGLIGSGVAPDGRRIVLVVNGLPDMQARADESARLLDWAYKNFENATLFKAGSAIENANVFLGRARTVPMVLKDDLKLTIPRGVVNDFKVTAHFNEPLVAPVKKGTEIGKLVIEIPRGDTITKPLYAGADVPRVNFFIATMEKARILLSGRT